MMLRRYIRPLPNNIDATALVLIKNIAYLIDKMKKRMTFSLNTRVKSATDNGCDRNKK